MLEPVTPADPLAAIVAEVATLRAEFEVLRAEMAELREQRAQGGSRFGDAERWLFARIAGRVVLGQEFEAGDFPEDASEAQRIGRLLGKVEKTPGGLMGLHVASRKVHGRRQWRLQAGVDLGGLKPAPQLDELGV